MSLTALEKDLEEARSRYNCLVANGLNARPVGRLYDHLERLIKEAKMNLTLTWLEKFTHLHKLDPNIALKLNERGYWYVSTQIRIVDDIGSSNIIHNTGIAKTPEMAVNDFWFIVVDNLPVGDKLVLGLGKNSFRWTGSRWINIV